MQFKASEAVTETMVGRWEWSRLLTGHCARHTHTHTRKNIHSCKLQHTGQHETTAHTHNTVCLKSFSLNTSHIFLCFLCGLQHIDGDGQHPPLVYPSLPSTLSLKLRRLNSWEKTLPCALYSAVSAWNWFYCCQLQNTIKVLKVNCGVIERSDTVGAAFVFELFVSMTADAICSFLWMSVFRHRDVNWNLKRVD